jgi:hypothetical protein
MLNDLKRGFIIRFVDIGGITDHHCLNFLSIILLRSQQTPLPIFPKKCQRESKNYFDVA